MSAVDAIVTRLLADPTISNLVGTTRVYDHDVRRSGWEKEAYAFDSDGVIKATVVVDDVGSTRPAFGHTAEQIGSVYVWAFGPRTDTGRTNVATLTTRVELLMHRWQVPETGALVLPVFRLGQQTDDRDAIFDRVTLQIAGVMAVSNF